MSGGFEFAAPPANNPPSSSLSPCGSRNFPKSFRRKSIEFPPFPFPSSESLTTHSAAPHTSFRREKARVGERESKRKDSESTSAKNKGEPREDGHWIYGLSSHHLHLSVENGSGGGGGGSIPTSSSILSLSASSSSIPSFSSKMK